MNKNHSEQDIDAAEADYLYVQASQIANSGMGLFTAIDLYKGEVVSLFSGKILTAEQAEKSANLGNDQYFMCMLDGSILDCMHSTGFAHYANDAEGFGGSSFKNNTSITLSEHGEVCLVAKRKIKAHDELFCSYGKRYWEKHA